MLSAVNKDKLAYQILTPDKCDSEHLRAFYNLVVEGGQVMTTGLMDRIKAADFLSFCVSENKIVGVASIKNPNRTYKKGVFKKAKAEALADTFDFEIGYAVTKKEYRGQGISQQLIKSLMDHSKSRSFFATTKVDDMRHILKKIGFEQLGENYKNSKKETLTLYQFNEKK